MGGSPKTSALARAFSVAFDLPEKLKPQQLEFLHQHRITARGNWSYYKYNAPIYPKGVLEGVEYKLPFFPPNSIQELAKAFEGYRNYEIPENPTTARHSFDVYSNFAALLPDNGAMYIESPVKHLTRGKLKTLTPNIVGQPQAQDLHYIMMELRDEALYLAEMANHSQQFFIDTMEQSTLTMWGLYSALAEREWDINIGGNTFQLIRVHVLDVLQLMPLPLQMHWITMWLTMPDRNGLDRVTNKAEHAKEICHQILKGHKTTYDYMGEKVVLKDGHPSMFRKRGTKTVVFPTQFRQMMEEYLCYTLYYLFIRHKDPTHDDESYRNSLHFNNTYLEPFRKAVEHNPSPKGKDWNADLKVTMLKEQLSDFNNYGKLMAMLIYHMCHKSMLDIITPTLLILTMTSQFVIQDIPNELPGQIMIGLLSMGANAPLPQGKSLAQYAAELFQRAMAATQGTTASQQDEEEV